MSRATPRIAAKKRTRKFPVLPVVLGVIAAALVAAIVFGTSEPGAEYGEPTVEGVLPPLPATTPTDTSATGFAAPSVQGEDFDGNAIAIANDGRAKAIVFLAHWCQHCQAEVPRVQAWLDSGGGVEGVDMYSVATAMDSTRDNFPASDWLDREGWTVPVIRDDADNTVLRSYGAGGFPYWVFVRPDGTVALRTVGQTTIPNLRQFMQALVTEPARRDG